MEYVDLSLDFIDFISKSPTKFHAVENVKLDLLSHGYKQLSLDLPWKLEYQGKYFVEQDNSAIIAFEAGKDILSNGVRLACAHTDSPAFKIKSAAEINSMGYLKLDIQAYAWPILSTWFDRPLSIAGRVACKGRSTFKPDVKLIDFKEPILLIPNIAFHLNKESSNNSISIQKEMMPIMGTIDKETDVEGYLKKMIANNFKISENDILDYELYLYPYDKSVLVGVNKEFIFAPKQDDLIMVYAAHKALENVKSNSITKMIAFFDAEEETNSTMGGADTPFLRNVLTKIVSSHNGKSDDIIKLIKNSFVISLDSAHALHPNYPERYSPTGHSIMNKGIVIKYDANMHYSTTAVSSAIIQDICNSKNIPYQKESANSDMRTGGTVSGFLQTQVEMTCVDVGIPKWATHSAFESSGAKDLCYLIQLLSEFWNIND